MYHSTFVSLYSIMQNCKLIVILKSNLFLNTLWGGLKSGVTLKDFWSVECKTYGIQELLFWGVLKGLLEP